jgi:hypothetical protein
MGIRVRFLEGLSKKKVFLFLFIIGAIVYLLGFPLTGEFPYGESWETSLLYNLILIVYVLSIFFIAYKKPEMPALLTLALILPHMLGSWFLSDHGSCSGAGFCFPYIVAFAFVAPLGYLGAYVLLKIFTKIVLRLRKKFGTLVQ